MATLFDLIRFQIEEDEYFSDFKFRKKGCTFLQKTAYGKNIIILDHWRNSDSQLVIYPIYGVRFDILKKWFEKFSFKSLQDQRDLGYVYFTGEMLNVEDKFYFNSDESNLIEECIKLRECIKNTSKEVFYNYASLESAYEMEITPILDGSKKLPDGDADYFFENLALCKIVHPEDYEKLKDIQLRHAQWLYDRREPNMSTYFPRLTEILNYLENYQFQKK